MFTPYDQYSVCGGGGGETGSGAADKINMLTCCLPPCQTKPEAAWTKAPHWTEVRGGGEEGLREREACTLHYKKRKNDNLFLQNKHVDMLFTS